MTGEGAPSGAASGRPSGADNRRYRHLTPRRQRLEPGYAAPPDRLGHPCVADTAMGSASAPFVVRYVTLPSGDVRIVPCSTSAPTLRQTAEAALAGDPVSLGRGAVLRLADLGAVVLGSVTDHAGDVRLALTLFRSDPGGRAWSLLSAKYPDLPRDLPAPWCAVRPAAGPLLCRLVAEVIVMD